MQKDITNEILELIRRTSSSLPKDVEERLRASVEKEEPGSAARGALETIMKNIELSRANSTPICQDTGMPTFKGVPVTVEVIQGTKRETARFKDETSQVKVPEARQ